MKTSIKKFKTSAKQLRTNRLQERIIRISALVIVAALLIGLFINIFAISDPNPTANNVVGSVNNGHSSLGAMKNSSDDSIADQDLTGLDNSDNSNDFNDSESAENDSERLDIESEFASDPKPYFYSGGNYVATDPQEIELLRDHPDVIDMDFAGDNYTYNPLEQWRYEKIQENHAKIPDVMLDLLERRPQSVHFVYKYLDYIHNPENYDPNAKSNITDFSNAQYITKKYPYYSNWDSTWGYLNYSQGFIATSGCGPVNFAMLVGGMNQDETMTPTKALQFARDNGYEDQSGKGTAWTLFSEGVKEFGITPTILHHNNPDEIIQALEHDKPVILMVNHPEFTRVGHFILLYEIQDTMVKLLDSNSVSNTNKMWDIFELLKYTQGVWTFHK